MIRPARPSEVPALKALVERAYGPWIPLVGERPAQMDDDYAARVSAGEAFVLKNGPKFDGLIVLVEHPGHLWVDNVAVEPEQHGTGLGGLLMSFAEAEARRRGLPEVRLLTSAAMERNIALYQRLGYAIAGRSGSGGLRRVEMAKRLGPG